jgi:uncharacterized protein
MQAGESRGAAATVWWRRHWGWLLAAALGLVALTCVVAAVSWHFSSAVLVPDHSDWPEDVTVEGLSPDRVVLSRSEDTERLGVYGLLWQGGHALIGAVITQDEETVTRSLRSVRGYLVPGMKVAIDPEVYSGNPKEALGLPLTDVRIPGELGPMPAWLIPGKSDAWAIVIHGINGDPEAGLRMAPTLHRAGMPALLITYREDLGAPSSPDDLHHMGQTEWRDLQAAVRYALSHGAERVVLAGYSMGGSIVAQFMQNSGLAPVIAGLILDAPALDWRETIKFNATEMGSPSFSTLPVEWAIGVRIDVDWNDLDAAAHPEDFQLPILLFHGTEDDIVPISISNEFAEELPRWVTYYRVPHAGHTEAWNVDPKLYDRRLEDFLLKLDASGAVSRQRDGRSGAPQ